MLNWDRRAMQGDPEREKSYFREHTAWKRNTATAETSLPDEKYCLVICHLAAAARTQTDFMAARLPEAGNYFQLLQGEAELHS